MIETCPKVSIIVPCRNEKDRIETCIRSIMAQNLPLNEMEVIVADGMSDDGTRDILKRLSREDQRLQIVDNPSCFTPCGMNLGIRKARGQYIAILGAHTEYASNYVRTCVKLLEEHPEACCSGGPIVSRGKRVFGRAVAVAMSHPVGVGNAKHRFSNYEGYAEEACFPVFRRDVFDRIGLFNESLIRNQDDEFSLRITRSGGKIFISPLAQCIYYVRETPLQLFRQYFQYGYYRVAVLRIHRFPVSIRQIVPVVFFSIMILLLPVSLFFSGWCTLIGCILPITYVIILGIFGVRVAIKEHIPVGLMFPVAAFILHFSYAVGFVWNLMGGKDPRVNNLSLKRSKST